MNNPSTKIVTLRELNELPLLKEDSSVFQLIIPCFEEDCDSWEVDLSFIKLPDVLIKTVNQYLKNVGFLAKHKEQTDYCIDLPVNEGQSRQIIRLIIVGLGNRTALTHYRFKQALNEAMLNASEASKGASLKRWGVIKSEFICSEPKRLDTIARAFYSNTYHFTGYKTGSGTINDTAELFLFMDEQTYHTHASERLSDRLQYLEAENNGITLAKNVANMPPNLCHPPFLADQARALARQFKTISTHILSKQELINENMNAYLAVNQASIHDASMPVMTYRGASESEPYIALIGKGVTFDTGGISLKQADGMHHMIYDMCGAAAVIGLMHCIASLQLNVNVVGILATAENAIDGNAYRPSDILKTKSGQTVEVISTDAEGRLVLCDAISYALELGASTLIDMATLTGAAITSLGNVATGLMSNSESLSEQLLTAGQSSDDKAWAFPIWDDYHNALDSNFADMKNSGSNSPGMITAGCFLSKYAEGVDWAHLDIAGSSFVYGKQNTANGRPIPMLLSFLNALAKV